MKKVMRTEIETVNGTLVVDTAYDPDFKFYETMGFLMKDNVFFDDFDEKYMKRAKIEAEALLHHMNVVNTFMLAK